MFEIEEKVLESLAWAPGSSFFKLLRLAVPGGGDGGQDSCSAQGAGRGGGAVAALLGCVPGCRWARGRGHPGWLPPPLSPLFSVASCTLLPPLTPPRPACPTHMRPPKTPPPPAFLLGAEGSTDVDMGDAVGTQQSGAASHQVAAGDSSVQRAGSEEAQPPSKKLRGLAGAGASVRDHRPPAREAPLPRAVGLPPGVEGHVPTVGGQFVNACGGGGSQLLCWRWPWRPGF